MVNLLLKIVQTYVTYHVPAVFRFILTKKQEQIYVIVIQII